MTIQQSLDGNWDLRQVVTQSKNTDLIVPDWIQAKVPGEVYLDLLNANLIPDPFIGENADSVQWVSRSDWEYRKIFNIERSMINLDKIYLCCEGLDTIAIIILNNSIIFKSDNMFREYRWEIKSNLNIGTNELRIQFTSPIQVAVNANEKNPLPGFIPTLPGSAQIRKAPYQFGWDWGPCLPSIGIWKSIHLEGSDSVRLDKVQIHQEHFQSKVRVNFNISVIAWSNNEYELVVEEVDPNGSLKSYEFKLSLHNKDLINGTKHDNNYFIDIPEPILWWPNDLGEHPLYQFSIILKSGAIILDRRKYQIGLRTIKLLQEPDEWGESFTFLVNGVPLFVKGANWVPADVFPTRITSQKLEDLIASAASAHMNMLRLWGGGYYESNDFYNLCDKYGILIWQDFQFACNVYPLDHPRFIDNIHHEIIETVSRLQHHASIVLWCGNNEIEWFWENMGWNDFKLDELKVEHKKFFHEVLPKWIHEVDPGLIYWPGSPGSHTPYSELDDETVGDMHYWGVWYQGEPFEAYLNHKPRFLSEFGFQSLAPKDTILKYALDLNLSLDDPIMKAHQRCEIGNRVILEQLKLNYPPPKDFTSLVYMSQICQAEGLRLGIEFWRRNRKRIGGVLYWQLNDCWPGTSWSSIDYFGNWKALHYAAKRFFFPILLSLHSENHSIEVHLTNDNRMDESFLVLTHLFSFDGNLLFEDKLEGSIQSLQSDILKKYDFSEFSDEMNKLVFFAELSQNGNILSQQTSYFYPSKDLELQNPKINANLSQKDNILFIDISGESLARQVELYLKGENTIFSDNYFDLPAKISKRVSFMLPKDWDLEKVKSNLFIKSLYDATGNGDYSVI